MGNLWLTSSSLVRSNSRPLSLKMATWWGPSLSVTCKKKSFFKSFKCYITTYEYLYIKKTELSSLNNLNRRPCHHFSRASGEDPGLSDHLEHAGLPSTLISNHNHLNRRRKGWLEDERWQNLNKEKKQLARFLIKIPKLATLAIKSTSFEHYGLRLQQKWGWRSFLPEADGPECCSWRHSQTRCQGLLNTGRWETSVKDDTAGMKVNAIT